MVRDNDQNENQEQKEQEFDQKDRGGNHNPEGANQYTTGRVDDRGRKEANNQEENNQDRNDERGRKK